MPRFSIEVEDKMPHESQVTAKFRMVREANKIIIAHLLGRDHPQPPEPEPPKVAPAPEPPTPEPDAIGFFKRGRGRPRKVQ